MSNEVILKKLLDILTANKIFEPLMGDNIEPRRAFIEKHAKYTKLNI